MVGSALFGRAGGSRRPYVKGLRSYSRRGTLFASSTGYAFLRQRFPLLRLLWPHIQNNKHEETSPLLYRAALPHCRQTDTHKNPKHFTYTTRAKSE
ncbi:hypothetical protein WMY93_015557 [Mugilogobius chulae]|uniref:Uncharacterized protein n=1 Tax=Mugilogobius chulae TaxID=88201 RepID=A0AAW0P1S4_9GOBI